MKRGHAVGTTLKPLVQLGKRPDDCWKWLGTKVNGYGKKRINGCDELAHRWIWRTIFGPIPDGLVVSHTCGNPGCVNPHHLQVVTQAENIRGGLGTILTPSDVKEIRQARAQTPRPTAATVAMRFGVHTNTVHAIWQGRSWRQRGKRMHTPSAAREAASA